MAVDPRNHTGQEGAQQQEPTLASNENLRANENLFETTGEGGKPEESRSGAGSEITDGEDA